MLNQMILLAQDSAEFTIDGVPVPFEQLQQQLQMQVAPPEMAAVGVFFLLFVLFWIFICLVMVVALTIIPLWMICKKAGISPYISLLVLVPGVNVAIYWILALIQWPNLKTENPNRSVPPTNQGELSHFQKEKYDRDSNFPTN